MGATSLRSLNFSTFALALQRAVADAAATESPAQSFSTKTDDYMIGLEVTVLSDMRDSGAAVDAWVPFFSKLGERDEW